MKKNICVFCGSRDGNNLDMIAKSAEIGRELSYAGFGIVFGGGRLGLMGAVAKAAIEANGSVIGIIPKGLTSREPIQQQLTELFVVDDIIERKRLMIEKKFFHHMCDMFLEMIKTMSIYSEEMKERFKIK